MTESFYDLLGVSTDADEEVIRRAYRRRIKETHPDVSDDPDASEKTARLVEARDVLTDEDERARYDRLGHEAYVSGGFGREGDDGSWTSQAADAAESTEGSTGPTNARAGTEERRRRERRAREDVDFGDDPGHSATETDGKATADWGTSTNDRASRNEDTRKGTTNRARATGGRTRSARGSASTSASRGPPPWSDTSEGWAARSPTSPPPGIVSQTVTAVLEAPATAIVSFLLYPLLVMGAFLPAFPLIVNGIVGACLLSMIVAAQSVAGLGVAIYGAWTVLGTAGVLVVGVTPFSPLGLVVLGTTWLPLGFSLLTYHVLDS